MLSYINILKRKRENKNTQQGKNYLRNLNKDFSL